jgi:glycosyltransferase involved in cell wall biosynthesis
MMKLLVTVPWGERAGGAENILWTFLRHVDRLRIEPELVFFEDGPFVREVRRLGLQAAVLSSGRLREVPRAARVVRALAGLIRREQPDLVLNWSAKTHLYGAIAARMASASDRVIWWQHGIPDGHWLDRLATALPARAIGCYCADARQAQSRLRPRRPSFVIHPGIDAPPPLSESERFELRAKLRLPQARPVIGIVGRLQPWKGQHRLLVALARLIRANHSVHGLIVGGNAYDLSPDYEPCLHRLAVTLGIADHVTFTGQVPDAGEYIQAMDVLVNASIQEPFGIVLLEAMAASLPIVAFASGGPREIIESGRSGLLVQDRTEEGLATAIEQLLVDPELRDRLGEAGRDRFQQRFTAERMTRDLETKFEQLCS